MLVLSRKLGESVVINGDIVIRVVECRGDKVRLGICAPQEMPVHRQEVFEAIRSRELGSTAPVASLADRESEEREVRLDVTSREVVVLNDDGDVRLFTVDQSE